MVPARFAQRLRPEKVLPYERVLADFDDVAPGERRFREISYEPLRSGSLVAIDCLKAIVTGSREISFA